MRETKPTSLNLLGRQIVTVSIAIRANSGVLNENCRSCQDIQLVKTGRNQNWMKSLSSLQKKVFIELSRVWKVVLVVLTRSTRAKQILEQSTLQPNERNVSSHGCYTKQTVQKGTKLDQNQKFQINVFQNYQKSVYAIYPTQFG